MILHLHCNGPLDDLVHKLKLEMGRKFEDSWKSSDSFLSLSLNYTDKEIWFLMIPVAFKKFLSISNWPIGEWNEQILQDFKMKVHTQKKQLKRVREFTRYIVSYAFWMD